MPNLKLFQIYDTKTNSVVPATFFADKPLAKQKRRELNSVSPSGEETLRYIVVPGPQHKRYKS